MMSSSSVERDQQQSRVAAYFDAHALDWKTIYERPGVYATIYQQRRARALRLIDGLALPAGTGCSKPAVARDPLPWLAERGHFVAGHGFCRSDGFIRAPSGVRGEVADRVCTSVSDIRDLVS
jgi:hypothetical protein